MTELTDVPNIGETLAVKLNLVGIENEQDLKIIGSENVIIKIATIENSGACINMLFSLEGAKQRIRWHGIDNERKQELKEFFTHSVALNTNTKVPEKVEWRNNISFNYSPNISQGFQKIAWTWNSTLAYSMLKDQGIITLKAFDLLNQKTNAWRIATANYVQDSLSTILQRYFMLSFS